jgi:glycosyltransferase involved in cell wall biosynthesis
MPRVSIVVGTYNAAEFVEATIASILAQTYRDFELIVVDDASSDETVSRIAAFGDSRIRLIRNPTNIGVANTRNVGADSATGEYLAMNDHDDLSLPTRLERQVAFLDERRDVLLAATGIYSVRDGKRTAEEMPPSAHHVLRWRLMTHSPVCHSSICVRLAEMRRRALRYDPTCDFGDDFDLYHRTAAAGRLATLQSRLVVYRWHANNASQVRNAEMNARGARMLKRAHENYLGMRLDDEAFDALWRVFTMFSPARSQQELRAAGHALASLLARHVAVMKLDRSEREDVERSASRQWWQAISRSAGTLGAAAFSEFGRMRAVSRFPPPLSLRLRSRLSWRARRLLSGSAG